MFPKYVYDNMRWVHKIANRRIPLRQKFRVVCLPVGKFRNKESLGAQRLTS